MDKSVYFKLEYIAEYMDIPKDEEIIIEDAPPINRTLTLKNLEVLKKGDTTGTLCTSIIRKVPSETINKFLESGTAHDSEEFKELANKVYLELADYIFQSVRTFRWRRNMEGDHNPIRQTKSLQYSTDGVTWKSLPGEFSIQFKVGIPRNIWSDELKQDIIKTIKLGVQEPLGHELFREAWSQQESNPRSALVIAIAAAEAGVKECIMFLVPETEWLLNKIQSPPIPVILKNYIPTLPAIAKINNQVIIPTKLKSVIQKGFELRNEILHKGKTGDELTADSLREILMAVRDLLYLLDGYCGYRWAMECISNETRNELANSTATSNTSKKDGET